MDSGDKMGYFIDLYEGFYPFQFDFHRLLVVIGQERVYSKIHMKADSKPTKKKLF